MTFKHFKTMTQEEIQDLKQRHHDLCIFADFAAKVLNELLIGLHGEEADWANHVGRTEVPEQMELLSYETEFLNRLWMLREGANGICASNNF
jgi:hypothetical protein